MSTKPTNKPVQNMTEINKLLADSLEAIKNNKAEAAALTLQLNQEREKSKNLAVALDRASTLILVAQATIKNQKELISSTEKALDDEKEKNNHLRIDNEREHRTNKLIYDRVDSQMRMYRGLFWCLVVANVLCEIVSLVIRHGGF